MIYEKFIRKIFLGGILFLQLSIIYGQGFTDEIIFNSNGRFFTPLITIHGNATVQWTFDDNTTSSLLNPSKDYGSEGIRANRLKVTPWSAIRSINIGYDASDGGSQSIPFVENQFISKIENLNLAAPYLEVWCSSYNNLDSLNFDNFINLKTIECFHSNTVQKVSLSNTPSLRRLCLEDNDLKTLDISDCTSLEDLRAALNDFENIIFSNSTEEFWHLCIRENNALTDSSIFLNMENFPAMRELLIWGTNQSGNFKLENSIGNSILILASQNNYSSLDLNGALLNENGFAEVNFRDNKLTSVNISGCKQLSNLNLSNNLLSTDSVDKVLQQLDELETNNKVVKLQGNSAPSAMGMIYKANLEIKGWTVIIDEAPGPKINITGDGVSIGNGDTEPSPIDLTDFGFINLASGIATNSFVIHNYGTDSLVLLGSAPYVSIMGPNSVDFSISAPPSNIIAPGGSTEFSITFNPSEIGLRRATISIQNNDQGNGIYEFAVQGNGVLANIEFYDGSTFTQDNIIINVDNAVGRFKLKSTDFGATLTGASIKLIGNRTGLSDFKFWASSDSFFNSDYDIQIGNINVNDPGDGGIIHFNSFSNTIDTNGTFFYLTAKADSNSNGYVQGLLESNSSLSLNGGLISNIIDSALLSRQIISIPVELFSIEVKKNGNGVLIIWQTASELNNAGFEIEKLKIEKSGLLGGEWEIIGYVAGQGSSTNFQSYIYHENNIITGSYLYRIKQIDYNGNYKYYNYDMIIEIGPPEKTELFQNYPNPFNPSTRIKFTSSENQYARLVVYDIIGDEVAELLNEKLEANKVYTLEFNSGNLASGVYFYRIVTSNQSIIKKMLILK